MKAIILAAGYATRLYPLTENCPKALLPVGGRSILDHLLSHLRHAPGLDEVHIVSNHRFFRNLSDWAEGARETYAPLKLKVWDDGTTSNENRLGAIGDIRFAIEKAELDDDLLVAASDCLVVDDKTCTTEFRQDAVSQLTEYGRHVANLLFALLRVLIH